MNRVLSVRVSRDDSGRINVTIKDGGSEGVG